MCVCVCVHGAIKQACAMTGLMKGLCNERTQIIHVAWVFLLFVTHKRTYISLGMLFEDCRIHVGPSPVCF